MRELSLNVMDIAQNSIVARASLIEITISQNTSLETLKIEIKDNGIGMTKEQLSNVSNPFYTTRKTRKVGLGIPFFKMEAEITGGKFNISSQPQKGTTILAEFISSSVDMTPLGDINSTISILIRCNPNIDFIFNRTINSKSFTLKTSKIKEVLGQEIDLSNNEVIKWIEEFLEEQTQMILGGAS